MNWHRIRGKCFAAWQILQGRLYASGSQAGEDQLIRYLFFSCLGINTPSYLDIGANHPFICNNTFYFYSRGSAGVCVEPDPAFFSLLKKYRKRDKVLQAGVGLENATEAALYVFPGQYSGWNTFLKTEADSRAKESGINYQQILKVPLVNINDIIAEHFKSCPNLISIDIEGLDFQILKSLQFTRYRPEVICVESLTFSTSNQGMKIKEIGEFMNLNGYFAFGDTYINTIFCRADAFNRANK